MLKSNRYSTGGGNYRVRRTLRVTFRAHKIRPNDGHFPDKVHVLDMYISSLYIPAIKEAGVDQKLILGRNNLDAVELAHSRDVIGEPDRPREKLVCADRLPGFHLIGRLVDLDGHIRWPGNVKAEQAIRDL